MKSRYYKRNIGMSVFLLTLISCVINQYGISQVSVEKTPGITTDISGTIYLEVDGNWLSQGSMIPGTSTLILNGATNQVLRQDAGSLYNVTIDKSGGEVTLGGNISLQGGSLFVLNQDLALNGFLITFDPSASLSETAGNTVKGPSGYLMTTRALVAPVGENVAGLGLSITSTGDFGTTEVRRGHAAQASNDAEGILRYFDVMPEFNTVESSVVFLYDESELNGNTEAGLKLFRSPDGGINWVETEGVLNTADNSFSAAGVNISSRFTLSSSCLETCLATVALTQSADVYLNEAGLALLLPEAVNNGSRGACGIDSLKVFPEAFDCSSVGAQEIVFTVYAHTGCTKTATTTVNVIDAVHPVVLCRDITIFLDEACENIIGPSDIDNGSSDACGVDLSVDVTTFDCDDLGANMVTLTATDPSGNSAQCVATVTVEMSFPDIACQDITIDMGELSSVDIDPLDLISGDLSEYEGFTFSVDPGTLHCDELGDHTVTLTATDPLGDVSTCVATVQLVGPDADCDDVADQCDVCDGGDDQQDTDSDGVPDCADWQSWEDLIEEWQCANNKVFVCHNGIVICINENAVQDHLNHGDFLGSCSAAYCDDVFLAKIPDDANTVSSIARGDIRSSFGEPDQRAMQQVTPDRILTENLPNPFFSETTIRFYLPMRERVTVSVFDIVGKPIAQLVEGMYEAGWHEVTFDGSDSPDGVYLYRLQTPQQGVTGAMVLVK